MSAQEKKDMIDSNSTTMSVSQQCKTLDLNRSTLYYKPVGVNTRDLSMMLELDKLYIEDPTRGTRRMRDELVKLGFTIGRWHTRSLMQIMRMKTIYCRPRTTVITPGDYKFPYLLRNLDISRVNQVWAIDITYVPMNRGYMYLVAIIDLKSRFIVGWSVSSTMESSWIIETLQKAVKLHGVPEIMNSDQGSQFTSEQYVSYVKSLISCKISMDGKGRAIDNVYIERFWRTIKYDKLYLEDLQTGHDVYQACNEFITYYNRKRDHSSLQKRTPEMVYNSVA
jgi:putative transposase